MKDILIFILKNITTHPEDIKVDEKIENGVKILTITTHPEDTGRVIGKEGKIIKAIRSIMRVAAIQKAERVRVSVVSESDSATDSTENSQNSQETVAAEVETSLPEEDQIDLSI